MSKPVVPGETLRIVQDANHSYWASVTVAGKPATQVVFDGHVTDISGKRNRVLAGEIPQPMTRAADVLLSNNYDARREQVLSPHECTNVRAVFFVQPAVAAKGIPWQTAIFFIDQYGNRHKVRNCTFKPIVGDSPPGKIPR